LSELKAFQQGRYRDQEVGQMALIDKKSVTPRETASYKLDCSTIALVKSYSEFIGSPQEHVVNEALLFVFRKDKDFTEWLKAKDKSELLLAGAEGSEGKRKDRALGTSAPAATGNRA
jgi:hypothetical protein